MTPELWEKLSPIFVDVIDRPVEGRRAAICQLCAGEPELERELLALVEAMEREETATLNISAVTRRAIAKGASGLLLPGDRLLERFTIVRHLGSGGMGNVYEAFDAELSQAIALKLIRPRSQATKPSWPVSEKKCCWLAGSAVPMSAAFTNFSLSEAERDFRTARF